MNDYEEPEEELEEDEDEICHRCSGSGEGMWDGSCCSHCRGRGVEPVEKGSEDYE